MYNVQTNLGVLNKLVRNIWHTLCAANSLLRTNLVNVEVGSDLFVCHAMRSFF